MSDLRGQTVLILANARAGSEQSQRIVESLLHGLEHAGLEGVVCWDREILSQEVAKRRETLRCVVAAGGDGTVMEVLNRAPGIPVAVLPLGTENLVARHCGIVRNGRAVAAAITAGRIRQLDVARASGRNFCLMAGAGFEAAVVHNVDRRRRGHISRLSYALPILQTLQHYPFPAVDVEVTDTGERLRGALVLVFNIPRYGLGLPIAPDAQADDGLLDLFVFERPGVFQLLRYVLAVLTRRHTRLRDVQHRQARRLRFSASVAVPVQMDGDPGPALPFEIEVLPRALSVVVP